jgi:shikimate dehydrogenase
MGLTREYRYDLKPILGHELQDFVSSVNEGAVEGANITIPYKIDVMNHIEQISDEALAIGSVNTLYRKDRTVVGSNTDALGFIASLNEQDVPLNGSKATILGAGGAAKAVAYALIEEGVSGLDIFNRTLVKAEALAKSLDIQASCEITVGSLQAESINLFDTNLLVNCTSIGMISHSINASPLRPKAMHGDLVVMDLVYNPRRTRLIKDAEQLGCKTIDGTGMLVHQGATALEMWVGEKPPIEVMRNAVIQELGG